MTTIPIQEPTDPEEPARVRAELERQHVALRMSQESIKTLIVEGPLYRSVKIASHVARGRRTMVVPNLLQRECDSATCERQRTWWEAEEEQPSIGDRGLLDVQFKCRNCLRQRYTVLLYFHEGRETAVEKVGQWPKKEVKAPKYIEAALGEHRDLYRAALILREHGFGIGAATYMRRVVEEITDRLLGLLDEVLSLDGARSADSRKTLAEARNSRVFDDRVKIAAGLLPDHLRPGGVNPFDVLHDRLSEGLHRLSEDTCIQIVDRCVASLDFLFTELDAHVKERKAYVERMRALQSGPEPDETKT